MLRQSYRLSYRNIYLKDIDKLFLLKREPDASDSLKYAPQRRTAIHIYSIQERRKKCKDFYDLTKFFNLVSLALLSVWIIWLKILIGTLLRNFSTISSNPDIICFISVFDI